MIEIYYLDNAATTKPLECVVEKANKMMRETFANPSSRHAVGLAAAREVEHARESVARLLGCKPEEVLFTSGGTESNNMAVFGALLSSRKTKIITTAGEHPSVSTSFDELQRRGYEVVRLAVLGGGPDLEQIYHALDENTALVSMMLVNNELGSIYPVNQIRRIARERGCSPVIHTDAVQAYGKIPFSTAALDVDLLSISAHKIGGLKGCGALYIKSGTKFSKTVFGGGQERGLRSGTQNTVGIAAFGVAAEKAAENMRIHHAHVSMLREYLKQHLPSCVGINAFGEASPYLVSINVPGYKSENLLHYLESKGVYVSAGSACSSNKEAVSPVLLASGVPKELADSTLRISFSPENTTDDVDALFFALEQAINNLKRG